MPPLAATWRQLAFWGRNKPCGHEFDLVSIEGQVVTEVREAAQDEYVLVAGGRLFTAIYRHPPSPIRFRPCCRCRWDPQSASPASACLKITDPSNDEVPFNILMRSFDDIEVVARPSFLNIRNMMIFVALLFFAVMHRGVRGWTLERRVRRQTADGRPTSNAGAAASSKTSTASRPWPKLSKRSLKWSPSDCRALPAGARSPMEPAWETVPANLSTLQVIQNEIPSRSGAPLGTIFAAFDRLNKPTAERRRGTLHGSRPGYAGH